MSRIYHEQRWVTPDDREEYERGQATRRRRMAALIYAQMGEPESDNEPEPETGRFLMLEEGSSAYAGRRWYSSGDSATELVRRHDDQEYAEDWMEPVIFDLDTREVVTVVRTYSVASVTPWRIARGSGML